eukprot:scaffold13180_cov89-Skeletonema_dohrnii-CCMP3373.AAC.1
MPSSLNHLNSLSQVRFHRTDYNGPGKYDERETGSKFGSHDHEHSHGHDHSQDDIISDDKKKQLREILQARFK